MDTADRSRRSPDSTVSPKEFQPWVDSFSEPQELAKIAKFLSLVEVEKSRFRTEQMAKIDEAIRRGSTKLDFMFMDSIDTCTFWKKTSENPEFKILAKLLILANKLLSIPASSASIERVFSQTGFIVRQNRNKLEDRLLDNFFLNQTKNS